MQEGLFEGDQIELVGTSWHVLYEKKVSKSFFSSNFQPGRTGETMARGVNKVILIGNLGADPEVRYTPSGTAVVQINIATSERIPVGEGNWEDRTEWHRVVAFGKMAENCGNYLSKGRQVYIEGRLQTRQWEDAQGVKRYTTEVIARDVQFLGSAGDQPQQVRSGQHEMKTSRAGSVGSGQASTEDLPPPPANAPGEDIPF